MDKIYTTTSYKQTQKLGQDLALRLRSGQVKNRKSAMVVALYGNLGGGKTTFLQGFAKGLDVSDKILSPTFVIYKKFKVQISNFKFFYHIDCYRLKDEKDMLAFNFKDIISNPDNVVAIEWPERIKKVLPKNTISIKFKFINKNIREIKISSLG